MFFIDTILPFNKTKINISSSSSTTTNLKFIWPHLTWPGPQKLLLLQSSHYSPWSIILNIFPPSHLNTPTLGTFDEHELPGAGILPSLWFYWYSLIYQPPVFRFDIRMILWHHGGFLICFGCLHHQGGHRGHRRQQGRHDGAWWRGGLVYHFQNDSLT